MATYYINASPNYTNKVWPYDTLSTGAESFSALLGDPFVNLADGDTILIYFPITVNDDITRIEEFTVDETALTSPISINKNIFIDQWLGSDEPPDVKPIVHVPDDCALFSFSAYGSISTIRHVKFFRTNMSKGPTLNLRNSYRVVIESCDFEYENRAEINPVDGFSMWIYMYKCMMTAVRGCWFKAPANDGVSYGNYSAACLFLDTCNEVDIRTNKFYMGYENIYYPGDSWGGIGKAITCAKSLNVRIKRNIIFDPYNMFSSVPPITGDYFGLIDVTDCDIIDIAFNCIYGVCEGFCGVRVTNNSVTMTNQYIRNNVAILHDRTPTAFVCVRGNTLVNMQIINNTITNGYTDQPTTNNHAIAFDVRLNKHTSVIDYNNIWELNEKNEIISDGNPENINTVGFHTQRAYPNINAIKCIDNGDGCSVYRSDLIDYVPIDGDAHTVGFGTEFTDIGSDYRSIQYFDKPLEYGQFCSVVDTVISSDSAVAKIVTAVLGPVGYVGKAGMYMYNANTTTSADALVGMFSNNITDEEYRNQFGWQYTDAHVFPFTIGSEFVGKNSLYILTNRDKLWPFDNITCPPNPGIGYNDLYPQYETGLFGYARIGWENGCSSYCIIQDTYSDVKTSWQKTTHAQSVYIDNWAHLPCEDK